jgi:hypothetical protein
MRPCLETSRKNKTKTKQKQNNETSQKPKQQKRNRIRVEKHHFFPFGGVTFILIFDCFSLSLSLFPYQKRVPLLLVLGSVVLLFFLDSLSVSS